MTRFIYLLILLSSFISNAWGEDWYLEKIPSLMKKYRVPGAAVALLKEGEIVAINCFGFRNEQANCDIEPSSFFEVGSISKTFAAWGILKLVEMGKIELDKPIEDYLSRWHLPPSDYDASQVTVRRVLNHTAGLTITGYYGYTAKAPVPDVVSSLNGIKGSHSRLEIKSSPGEQFEYSGGGYTLLQLLVEEVSGQSFQDFMTNQIFLPLSLLQSTYSLSDEQRANLCTGYSFFGKRLLPHLYTESAAAGLYSTIEDIATFAKHTLDIYRGCGNHLLQTTTLKKMMDAQTTSYALGYDMEILSSNAFLAYHEGANPGWRSGMYLLPTLNSALVILTNSERGMLLINDVANDWLFGQTNMRTEDHRNLEQQIRWIHFITILLVSSWAVYVILFFRSRIPRKKLNTRAYLQSAFWLLLGLCWFVIFYTPFIHKWCFAQGPWIIGSFMPFGFGNLTVAILLWSITKAITSIFFRKNKIHFL